AVNFLKRMLRIFEAIKKSPFLNGNLPLSSPSANASAENGKFKMKEDSGKRTEETRHSTEPDKARNGISTLNYSVASFPSIISTEVFLRS
ncbi:MAG: hypothetical protein II226_04425, partial [Alistipes sp.]|nr:hypothetical protein [Alistipes sp.]